MTKHIQSNVMQWKFTSCGFNIENRSGFSTFSMSEGLALEDKEDLVKFAGGYSAPDGLPLQPITEEELALFPIAFSSFILRSGKRAVTRTRYVGKDYAGVRFGNLFSHGLIIAGNWNFAPIRLYNSPLFSDGLTVEEQNLGHTPELLPCLVIDEEHLHNFLVMDYIDDAERYDWFKKLLFAVGDYKQSGKTTVLRDNEENVSNWFAALQYTFPNEISQDISFSTYVRSLNAASAFQVAATSLEGNSISFDSAKLSSQCFPFDFASGNVPSFEKHETLFLSRLSRDTHPSDELRKVFDFLAQCGIVYCIDNETLDNAVLLYDQFVPPSCSLNDEQFNAMLLFFQEQPSEVQQRILENHDFFPQLKQQPFDRFERLVRTFAKTVYLLESSKLQERFHHGFLSQIESVFDHIDSQFTNNQDTNKNNLVLDKLMKLFNSLPDTCKSFVIDQFLRKNNNKRYNIGITPLLVKHLSPHVNSNELFNSFVNFIIKQCDYPLQADSGFNVVADDIPALEDGISAKISKIYATVIEFSDNYRNRCEGVLSYLEKTIEQNPNRIFMLFFMFWVLHVKSGKISQSTLAESVKRAIRNLHFDEQKMVFEKGFIGNNMWQDATSVEVHKWLDETFNEVHTQQDWYCYSLSSSGSKNWREGKEAEVQANAFMEYILNAPKLVFDRWTKPLTIAGVAEITSCFVPIGHTGNHAALDPKEKEIFSDNINHMLDPLVSAQNKERLDTLRIRLHLARRSYLKKCLDWCVTHRILLLPISIFIIFAFILLLCWIFGTFDSTVGTDHGKIPVTQKHIDKQVRKSNTLTSDLDNSQITPSTQKESKE